MTRDILREIVAEALRTVRDREALDRADEARLGVPRGSIVRDGDPRMRVMYPTPRKVTP